MESRHVVTPYVVTRYVAIVDSSTEGLDDPDGAGGWRGWSDRLADIAERTPVTKVVKAGVEVLTTVAAA